MKYKRLLGMVISAALAVTALPVGGSGLTAKAAAVPSGADETIRILPSDASKFHDTDGNGFGEFEGWGTSLCWWANRIGYSEKMTKQAADVFFGDGGLDLNIGRYNVGGGDYVGENVSLNEHSVVYDIADATEKNPVFGGSKMAVEASDKLKDAFYSVSDADFGITAGTKVGTYHAIGWVNELGAAAGDGGNLTYTVEAKEAGAYTVKLLMYLEGSNSRGAAIRINGDPAGDKKVASDVINKNVIANTSNRNMYRITFEDVALNKGENTITIGGNSESQNHWSLDFVKMAVIPKGKEKTVDDMFHASHITRSDSAVPGYCVNVTKLPQDATEKDAFLAGHTFDRVDEACGYAWNYDWNADKNQMEVLKAAAEASGTDFIAEAFSNSPPYFMTKSGCTSGALNAAQDNLREDSYAAFAAYMADVVVHWIKEGVIDFQSVSLMNEPDTNYWGAYSNKQEGCHFDPGTSQSAIIEAFAEELKSQKEKETDASVKTVLDKIILAASDETDIDKAITNYNSLSDGAKAAVGRIDTHTYSGSDRKGLRTLAESANQNLWMSEVDGSYTAGNNAGEMTAALGLAQRIITDLNGLKSSAWIFWNAIDSHADAKSAMRTDADHKDIKALYQAINLNGGYWGLAFGDHNNEEIMLTKKYYGFGQFTKYIRPGFCIIGSSSDNALAAYDPAGKKAVIVAVNTSANDKVTSFDLRNFTKMGDSIQAVRSSGSLDSGENWADVSGQIYLKADTKNRSFDAVLKGNSITTFIIEGVEYDRNLDEDAAEPAEIPLQENMLINASQYYGSNPAKNVIDGNFSTHFDGYPNGWITIDLGEIYRIDSVGYGPRSGYAYRCLAASFYGSNDGKNWTQLYKISQEPPTNTITKKGTGEWETESNYYRYVKYSTEGSTGANDRICCNVAELKLYGVKTNPAALAAAYEKKAAGKYFDATAKEAFSTAVAEAKSLGEEADAAEKMQKMAAVVTAYDSIDHNEEIPLAESMVSGSPAWNNGTVNVAQKVVDNNFDTFFDGLSDGYIEIDLGKIYQINRVGYAPRANFAPRCVGGRFYGSNDKEHWHRLYEISENPPYARITKKKMDVWETDSNCYRYIRYDIAGYNGSDPGCNLSELKLYGVEADIDALTAYYEQRAALYDYAGNDSKKAFDAAVAAAKTLAEDAGAADKEKAMADVVKAYEELKPVMVYDYITGAKGDLLRDTKGDLVQAHGGQVQKLKYECDYDGDGTIDADEKEFWYWIGEDRSNGYRPTPGVHAYISKDLYNWKDMGVVLKTVGNWETFTTDKYFTDLYGDLSEEEKQAVYADLWTNNEDGSSGCVLERPKMLYNEKNNNYVIWFHADGQVPDSTGGNYSKAKAGVAVSDSPFGPFKLLGSYMLNYNPNDKRSDEEGGHVRDMNVFKDDDGTAYVQYSSDNNQVMHISKMNEDYTNIAQPDNEKAVEGADYARAFIGDSREAPAMFKYHGKYYMITSGCTGWDPNAASYAVADHPFGPWTTVGNPCTGAGADKTFYTQSTCVIPVDAAHGKFIYMGDRWTRSELHKSRYVWLPIEFLPQERIALRSYSNWKLYELENKGTYMADTTLPAVATIAELKDLPPKVTIKYDDGKKEVLDASWSGVPTAEHALGTANIVATLSNGYSLTYKVHLMDDDMIYFFDCDAPVSQYVEEAVKYTKGNLRNTEPDRHYTFDEAGYISELDLDVGSKSYGHDVWSHGYYAMADKSISYAFNLEAGKYILATGQQEWWNETRPSKITVYYGFDDDTAQLASKEFTLSPADGKMQQNLEFEMTESGVARVVISKTGGFDPLLSWISVLKNVSEEEKAALRVEEAKKALRAPVLGADDTIALVTSHENGSRIVWSVSDDTAVLISSDGKKATALRQDAEKKVTFTAEITDGIVSTVRDTVSFEITIPAKDKPVDPTGKDPTGKDPSGIEAAKKELADAVKLAGEKNESEYTEESWQKLKKALEDAANLPEDADKAAIERVTQALQAAIDGLEKKTPVDPDPDPAGIAAAKKELADAVKLAGEKNEAEYTQESWQKLKKALEDAANLPEDADKAAIERAAQALRAAIDGLEKKIPVDPDLTDKDPSGIEAVKKELQETVKEAGTKKKEEYTEESWQKLEEALETVKNLPEDADKAAIEQAMNALKQALANLKEKKPVNPDPTGKDPTRKDPKPDDSGNINTKPVKVSSMKFASKSYQIAIKKKLDLRKELTVLPANAADKSVTWTLAKKDSKYASMKNGVVTMKKSGAGKTVTVTAEAKDGSGKKAVVKIKIMKNAVTKITVKKKRLTVKAGKKAAIKPNVKTNGKKANKKLAWTSSNVKYATVNAKGVVSTKKAGAGKTVTVTASSTDGTNKKVKIKIKIRK